MQPRTTWNACPLAGPVMCHLATDASHLHLLRLVLAASAEVPATPSLLLAAPSLLPAGVLGHAIELGRRQCGRGSANCRARGRLRATSVLVRTAPLLLAGGPAPLPIAVASLAVQGRAPLPRVAAAPDLLLPRPACSLCVAVVAVELHSCGGNRRGDGGGSRRGGGHQGGGGRLRQWSEVRGEVRQSRGVAGGGVLEALALH
mmetsp:Transcript_102575/g.328654  ORF Transcript_102575/g.328654 Transcript_102575/m.328654 type:complete len:202 (+) Transcript_102575:10-615(+)